jgi:glucose uptake protein GlcU
LKKNEFIIAGIIIVILIGIGISMESMISTTDKTTSNAQNMLMHIHPRLYLNIDGQPYFVPQNVGIDPSLWKDHSLDQYGMIGMAPLHTHTADGMIHVESTVVRNYTLGEFLDIWGLDLKGKSISVTVNGEQVSDYRNHIFKDEESIIMNMTSNH